MTRADSLPILVRRALFVLFSAALAVGALGSATIAASADPSPAQTAAPSRAALAALAKQLDDDSFARREEASSRLEEAGVAAIDALRQAATGDSLEASTRAFAVLKKFLAGSNTAAQNAARATLEKIAAERDAAAKKGNDSLVAAAARASDILKSTRPGTDSFGSFTVPGGFGSIPRRPLPGFGGIRIAPIPMMGGFGSRISIQVVNGTRKIEIDESQADGRKRAVKIATDPQAGIQMEVTTTKAGKQQTEKYQARDVDTLKKEHPEAYQLYEKYAGANGHVIQFGGGQIHVHGGQIAIGGAGGPQIDALRKLTEEMQKLNEANAEPEATRRRIDELKKRVDQLRRPASPDRAAPAPD